VDEPSMHGTSFSGPTSGSNHFATKRFLRPRHHQDRPTRAGGGRDNARTATSGRSFTQIDVVRTIFGQPRPAVSRVELVVREGTASAWLFRQFDQPSALPRRLRQPCAAHVRKRSVAHIGDHGGSEQQHENSQNDKLTPIRKHGRPPLSDIIDIDPRGSNTRAVRPNCVGGVSSWHIAKFGGTAKIGRKADMAGPAVGSTRSGIGRDPMQARRAG
jgi:hypothetical protein